MPISNSAVSDILTTMNAKHVWSSRFVLLRPHDDRRKRSPDIRGQHGEEPWGGNVVRRWWRQLTRPRDHPAACSRCALRAANISCLPARGMIRRH